MEDKNQKRKYTGSQAAERRSTATNSEETEKDTQSWERKQTLKKSDERENCRAGGCGKSKKTKRLVATGFQEVGGNGGENWDYHGGGERLEATTRAGTNEGRVWTAVGGKVEQLGNGCPRKLI